MEILLDIGPADHVENYIHPLFPGKSGYLFDPVLLLIVDGSIGTEFSDRFSFLGIAYGRINRGAEGLAKLDGSGTDPARTSMHEELFTGLQSAAIKNICPDGKIGFRKGSRFHQSQPLGDGQTIRSRGRTVLRIPSPGG